MANLLSASNLQGADLAETAGAHLSEVIPDSIFCIAPFAGSTAAVSEVLYEALQVSFPQPGESQASDAARILWSGRAQAFLFGAPPASALAPHAAVTDITDGWSVLRLEGRAVRDVLARLTPLDLRPAQFGVGTTARSELGHMAALITRTADDTFDVMVMRSFARTAAHDLNEAMRALAGRARS
ncbi:MAG: sarcosine oxidase subunit gamma family protein [Pseudomonadota bacterium]